MKSNPYVYPYVPFVNLNNKNIKNNFTGKKTVAIEDIKKIISKLDQPVLKIKGKAVAEKIFSIFLDSNFLFGPREFLTNNRKKWIEKINYFIEKNQKIKFTLLGFPFKMAVPLKTDRKLPDMGEVLSLARLNLLCDLIKKEYELGAMITVFSEGAFDDSAGIPEKDSRNYHNFLVKLNKNLGFNKNIKIIPLSKMEKLDSNFSKTYQRKIKLLKNLFKRKDADFLKKYEGARESIYRIVSTIGYDEIDLMDAYNEKISDNTVSRKAKEIRKKLNINTREALFKYFAYLLVRDDLNFIEKTVPYALSLSVSPKPNRLGIIPIHKECKRLPYHSVPVFYHEKNKFLLEYLIDIKRSSFKYKKVFLDKDREKIPFYYEVEKK